MQDRYWHLTIKYILIIVILGFSFLYLIRPIDDPDFFWHIKTGEWIWQNRSLPSEDPFAYTTQGLHSTWTNFILTGYWLSQILYYLCYAIAKMPAVIFLRFFIVGFIVYFMMRLKKGDDVLYSGLLLIFLLYFLGSYPLDRPQVFSFLFFAILLYLLKGLSDGRIRGKALLLLPLVMLIWPNMHGGFVLGVATIILFLTMEGVKFVHPSLLPIKKEAYKGLMLSGTAGIVLSLANPNTYHPFVEMIRPPSGLLYAYNTEYLSSLEAFTTFNDYKFILYWLVLLGAVAGIIFQLRQKKLDITEAALLAGMGFFSFTTIRYIAFFMIAALPALGKFLSEGRLVKFARIFIAVVALTTGISMMWDGRFGLHNLASQKWIREDALPVRASDFIINNNLRGNMYNPIALGGYLIWRFAPDRKVFVDGRTLSEDACLESILIDTGDNRDLMGMPSWKAGLEVYSIQYILTPFYTTYGAAIPLVVELSKDNDWIPVYHDFRYVIFVKNLPSMQDIIRNDAISKDSFINVLIEECDKLIEENPTSIFPYITKGDLYASTSRFKQARETYEKVLDIAPLNAMVRSKLESLDHKNSP